MKEKPQTYQEHHSNIRIEKEKTEKSMKMNIKTSKLKNRAGLTNKLKSLTNKKGEKNGPKKLHKTEKRIWETEFVKLTHGNY